MAPGRTYRLAARALEVLSGRSPVLVGTTPASVVMTENKVRLLRYASENRVVSTPVLLLPSMVNTSSVFDLTPDNSVVKALLRAGFDVFLLDWGRPSREDRLVPAEAYLDDILDRAVRRALLATGRRSLTLVGYCMGGTMGLIHAALRPDGIRNLVLLATPVDFGKGGKLAVWAAPFAVERFVSAFGNPPPKLLHAALGMLVPTWQARQWRLFFKHADNDAFYRQFSAVGRWVGDNVEVPARAFESFVRDCYQDNLLVKGELVVGGSAVRLGDVRASVLNVVARRDHIVPPDCSLGLAATLDSRDVTERVFDCGHVGLSIGGEAQPVVWPAIVEWLRERSGP